MPYPHHPIWFVEPLQVGILELRNVTDMTDISVWKYLQVEEKNLELNAKLDWMFFSLVTCSMWLVCTMDKQMSLNISSWSCPHLCGFSPLLVKRCLFMNLTKISVARTTFMWLLPSVSQHVNPNFSSCSGWIVAFVTFMWLLPSVSQRDGDRGAKGGGECESSSES